MRIFSSVAAGAVAGVLFYFLVTLAVVKASVLVFIVSWAFFALLFYHRAYSVRDILTRACLVAAVECLVIPMASWVLPIFYGQESVQAAKQGASAAGQAFGSTLGGGLINILSGYFGLVIGFLLLATVYLSLRPARRKR